MPIRRRLALAFALATLVLVGAGGLLFEHSFRHGLEQSLDTGLRAQGDTLAAGVRDVAAPDLRAHAPSTLNTQDVVAQVLEPTGSVVAATIEAGDAPVVDAATARAALGTPVYVDRRLGREHEHVRLLARSVSGTGGRRVAVVGTSLEPTDDAVGRVRDALLVGGSLAVVLAGVGGWLLARAALRPVERMRREAADLSDRDSAARLLVPGTRDEIASLATTINELLGRLHEALERQRSFVANASHELRTPLAVLRTELELAGRRPRSEQELREVVDHAAEESERLSKLAEELLFLARADDERCRAERAPVALAPLVEDAAAGARAAARSRAVDLVVEADAQVVAPVTRDLMRRAVENLLENALRYAPDGSTIVVGVRVDGDDAVVDVVDAGPGFPPSYLPRAFERFTRADESRTSSEGGAGLGLAIVLAVARSHGGTAVAGNRPGGGAIATIRVPRSM